MPRSSRHKSSKHSSKEAKEYSDSEKDSGVKDRKGKAEESGGVRVSKDSSSSEKRKVDSKDGKDLYGGSGNGDYSEDYSSSKRRKERVDDRASDRWNGGEDDHRSGGVEGSKKSSKASADSKSKRRDESMGMYEEAEEVKKSSSSGKGEGRHRDRDRDSGRKEGRDGGVERDRDKEKDRDRKSKEGRSERLVGGDEHRSAGKQVVENSDLNAECESGSPEADSQLERRMRKRRDSSIDMGKRQDDVGDISDRRLSSRDDIGKDGKQKDERRKEERYKEDRYKEKHREDVDRDSKHRDDRQREERSTKDHLGSKSEDKHVRDEKDTAEMQSKTSKLHDGERKGENDRDRDRDRHRDLNPIRDRDRDRHHDREREHERERARDRDYDRDHEWDWDGDRDRDRDRERNRERERERDRDRDRDYDRGHDFDRDYGSSHLDDRTTRYKDSSRAKRRSPDDRDDLTDIPSRGSKARYSDVEKKSVSGARTESDANKRRSHSRQTHVDMIASNDKQRNSPSSSPHVGLDESRYVNPEDLKYRDSTAEQRSKAVPSKDASGFSGALERGSKHRSMEKSSKMDDTTLGELSNEKSSSSKASPLGLIERSPSSSSIDRRYMNRTGARRSLDIEETGRRSTASIDNRDFDDRLSRDLPSEKPLVDESSPVDSSFYNRNNQANTSSIPPHPAFRAGVDSPFVGSLEDDGRVNSSSRYRRNGDPNMGRGHNNAWRGVPNWTSPLPNGFIPFQHGPPGTFQGIMPQFPGPIFGVRPSLDINHSGMPYHIPDADRFSSHLRPLGWQNMMDATGPSHLHGWDGSNGVFRDDPHLFGAAEWEQNRHPMNTRGRESSVDTWKGQNGDAKRDLLSPSHKDDYPVQASVDDALAVQVGQMSNHEDNREHGIQGKLSETRSGVTSSAEESTPKVIHEKKVESSKSSKDDVSCLSRYYLSKLDISAELARPELYNQCMSLLDIDQSETTDEETIRLIMSKDYLRAGAKSSKTLWISSHFPSIKDSVFQRAMNLYRKERIEAGSIPFLSKRTLDIVSKPKKENVEEQIHGDEEKVEDPVPTSDTEMVDALNTGLDVENVEAVSSVAAEEKMEVEVISIPCHEEQNHNCSRSTRLEVLVKEDFPDNLGETLATSNGVEAEAISSEVVISEDTTADGIASLDNASLPVAPLSSEGDKLNRSGEANGGHCVNHVEEGMAFSDGLSGRVLVPDDGSPKDSEAVMSGSNESESVNISRIHHSPESTH